MKKIDILAYKMEAFDSDCFKEDIISYSSNSIVLMFNQKGIWVAYKPLNYKIKNKIIPFFRFNKSRLDYYLYPILFLIDHFKILKLVLSICLKCRVKIILVANTYVAAFVGIIRKFNLAKKMIYVPGDWLAGDQTKRGIYSYIGSDIVFPFFDFWACRLSDVTLNCTKYITEARYNYWGRTISKKEMVCQYQQNRLKIKKKSIDLKSYNKKILFFGNVRCDSGLELAIKSLRNIRINLDVVLKIIGPHNDRHKFLDNLAKKYQVDKFIEFIGFIEREHLEEVFSDCFCGINLIMEKESYTSKTLPAKVFEYLQYLLPVIVTENVGLVAEIVKNNRLGLVIETSEEAFIKAVIEIYERQEYYRKNIIEYINSLPRTSIIDFLVV